MRCLYITLHDKYHEFSERHLYAGIFCFYLENFLSQIIFLTKKLLFLFKINYNKHHDDNVNTIYLPMK